MPIQEKLILFPGLEKNNLMKYFLNIVLIFLVASCGIKNKDTDGIEIKLANIKKPMKIILKDSLYLQIVFDSSGRLSSILPYRAGILEGNAYEFFANGKFKKRMELKSGRLDGIAEYFYENGNLWKQILSNKERQEFMKVIYWNGIIPVVKNIFNADSTGVVLNIKVFDQKGNFIKDSVPSELTKIYPE